MRRTLIWLGVLIAVGVPLALAASSPLLAWRQPIYIVAGFAGVLGLGLLLLQPLLIIGHLSGLARLSGRQLHRWVGVAFILAILVHVGGLWITSPPDVIDALTFTSPTPFSNWGVIAMWAAFAAAFLALYRKRVHLRTFRLGHTVLVAITVVGTTAHAMLIDGTMEPISKTVLCLLVFLITVKTIVARRAWTTHRRKKPAAF